MAVPQEEPKFKETLWEWRAFVPRVNSDTRKKILNLPKKHDKPLTMNDRYICRIGSNTNIKIRVNDLRIKRRAIVCENGVELFTTEVYSFPISAHLFGEITNALNIALPKIEVRDGDQLISTLFHSTPSIRILDVLKYRELYKWPADDPAGVVIELAEINMPERVNSISVEHRDLKKVNEAIKCLRLQTRSMRVINYSECIEIWVEGKSLFE
jgi:hypothetical protein